MYLTALYSVRVTTTDALRACPDGTLTEAVGMKRAHLAKLRRALNDLAPTTAPEAVAAPWARPADQSLEVAPFAIHS
jgi:hypothetical protein